MNKKYAQNDVNVSVIKKGVFVLILLCLYIGNVPAVKAQEICPDSKWPSEPWELISHQVDSGNYGIMGRTNVIVADQWVDTSLQTVYVGTENSGLWRTENFTDDRPKWNCLTEGFRYPGAAGAIDVSINPKNTDHILVGTGVGVIYQWEYGAGILQSTDHGKSWNKSSIPPDENRNFYDVFQKVAFLPSRKNNWKKQPVIAYSGRSIFTSSNSGTTFTEVYKMAATNEKKDQNCFHDLAIHPFRRGVCFASGADHHAHAHNSPLLVSIDYGRKWKDITYLLLDSTETLGQNRILRIDLSISRLQPDVLWAYLLYEGKKRRLVKIENAWTKQPIARHYNNASGPGSTWMCELSASEVEKDLLYFGRVRSYVFTLEDEGNTFKSTSHPNNFTIHADKRGYAVVKKDNRDWLLCAHDGGVALGIRTNKGKCSWQNKSGEGLTITQFYGLGVQAQKHITVGGAQDLGGFYFDSEKMKRMRCGDGYRAEVDDRNGAYYIAFNSKVGAFPSKSSCGQNAVPIGRKFLSFKVNKDGKLIAGGFASGARGDQLLPSKVNGSRIFIYDPKFKKYNEIASYPHTMKKPILAKKDFESGIQRINKICLSSTNKNVFYVSGNKLEANKNRLWRVELSDSSEVVWKNLTTDLNSKTSFSPWQVWQPIRAIASGYSDNEEIWLGFGNGYNSMDYKIMYHKNAMDETGGEWIKIDRGLPGFPINHLELDPVTNHLYAATDVGVYVNRNPRNASSSWECFSKGLPVVKVTDLEIEADSGEIFISTFGRGLFKANLLR